MEDIKRSHVIQWVGPFKSDKEIMDFVRRGDNGEACHSACFTFYFLSGVNRIGRPQIHRYFGIHRKLNGIHRRLNYRHSVLSSLKKDSSLKIWIGRFGDRRWHSGKKVEEVESFFIRYYRELLTDNEKKKKSPLDKLPSMSVVNLWYDKKEVPWIRKPASVCFIQDVMVWENASDDGRYNRLLSASKLSEREE